MVDYHLNPSLYLTFLKEVTTFFAQDRVRVGALLSKTRLVPKHKEEPQIHREEEALDFLTQHNTTHYSIPSHPIPSQSLTFAFSSA